MKKLLLFLLILMQAISMRAMKVEPLEQRLFPTINKALLRDFFDTITYPLGFKTKFINTAKFSPDSSKMVTTTVLTNLDNNPAEVWDANAGQLLYTLQEDNVIGAQFNPDGTQVITVSHDGRVKIWQAISGKCLYTFEKNTDYIISAYFDPDCARMITTYLDTRAKILDGRWKELLLDRLVHTIRPDQGAIMRRAFEATRAGKVYEIRSESEEMTLLGSIGRRKVNGILQPIDESTRNLQRSLKNILNIRIIQELDED